MISLKLPNLLLFFSWRLRRSCRILAEIRYGCLNDYLQDPINLQEQKHTVRKLVLSYRYLGLCHCVLFVITANHPIINIATYHYVFDKDALAMKQLLFEGY